MKHANSGGLWWPVVAGATVVAVALGLAIAGLGPLRSLPVAEPSRSVAPGPALPAITAMGDAPTPPVPSIGVSPQFDLTLYSIDDPESPWVIVNKERALAPRDYVPSDMRSLSGVPGGSSQSMRTEAADALVEMHSGAVADGTPFEVSTAYRSYSFQSALYSGYVNEHGRASADTFSARPGHSEHQTGWALDVCTRTPCRHTTSFADEPAGRWLAENAWRYGFIIRYGEGQAGVTGYIAEPWHLRYVGPELAEEWHKQGRPPLETLFGLPPAATYG